MSEDLSGWDHRCSELLWVVYRKCRMCPILRVIVRRVTSQRSEDLMYTAAEIWTLTPNCVSAHILSTSG